MRKIINAPDRFVDEVIEAVLHAHPGHFRTVDDARRALVRADAPGGRVGIVTAGGSGHLPVFLGYVGPGLCSGVAVGNVFSSPSMEAVLAATKGVDGGRGVLYLLGNYSGDRLTAQLAGEFAEVDGITTATVLIADDVLSAAHDRAESRRGIAGMGLVFHIAGASAERGDDLDEVRRIAQKAADHTRPAGVGLSPTIMPTTGEPSFELPDGEMEIGIGIHGEPGRHRGPIETADHIADRLLSAVLDDLAVDFGELAGSEVSLLVNGLGATPMEELYLLHRRCGNVLEERGVRVVQSRVGEFATSLEMAGASITVLLLDDELRGLTLSPAYSPLVRL
jgi:dihydroxyacetone kinase